MTPSSLRPRLSADAFAFFQSADVHDGRLIGFRVHDFDPLAPKPAPGGPDDGECGVNGDDPCRVNPYRVSVELSVAEWTETQWTLRYARVRRVLVDFPSDSPLFYDPGAGFEDWGHHELTDPGDGFLRHEVLFSSGSTILVEFLELSVERLDRTRPPTSR